MSMQQKLNNRTGAKTAPDLLKEMIEGAKEFSPSSPGDATGIAQARVHYAREAGPIGTLPPPSNAGQFQQGASRAPNESTMDAFMDKLGARLAFERTGTRLYEALLSKHQAFGGFPGGPSPQDIQRLCDQELQHFKMLRDCIEQLGGDPTAITPSADVEATAGTGINMVLADARTDLIQSLHAILVAELADHASWETLHKMAGYVGEPGMAELFLKAIQEEEEHLRLVKGWLSAAQQQTVSEQKAA